MTVSDPRGRSWGAVLSAPWVCLGLPIR